jgi:AAA domain
MADFHPDQLDMCPASDVRPEPLAWLWPGRLALGKVSLFEGDPDLGKSLVALDLCARLSTGRPAPDGQPLPGPAASLYLNAEDAAQDTILPRLQALGADCGRVFVLHRKEMLLDEHVALPTHCDFLDRMLTRTGARLLVLDPFIAFLDATVASGNDQSVRRALRPLAVLAQRHHSALLAIRHLNKKGGDTSLYRGAGTIGVIAHCRSAWLFAREPLPPSQTLMPGDGQARRRCVLAQQKNNLGPPQPSLAYEVVAGDGPAPALRWHGPCGWTAAQLLARPRRKEAPARRRARVFLQQFLADGPRTTEDIWPAGMEHDLYERTLHRAKKDLGLRTREVTVDGKRRCYWMLPSQTLPAEVGPEGEENELDVFLKNMAQQFTPPTPLDEGE